MQCSLSLGCMSLALTWTMLTFQSHTSCHFPTHTLISQHTEIFTVIHVGQALLHFWVFVHSLSLCVCISPSFSTLRKTTHSPRIWSGRTWIPRISQLVAPSSVFLLPFGEPLIIALRILYFKCVCVFLPCSQATSSLGAAKSIHLYSLGAL